MAGKYAIAVLAVVLAGCGSLPMPDRAKLANPVVQMEGSQGTLSTARSARILERRETGSVETSIFTRHLKDMEGIAGSPLVTGNKVTLLLDGPVTYQSMYDAIQGAKDSINMETYNIEDDEVGRRFAEALIEKQKKGVQVNFIYDSVGSGNTPGAFFKSLADSGVNVLEFNPINPLLLRKKWEAGRDHRKLLVVDGKIAFLGGVNINSVYSSGSFRSQPRTRGTQPWRDTHLRVEGPVVAEFQQLFLATWQKQKGKQLNTESFFPKQESRGSALVRAIGSSPGEPYNAIYVTLLSAIDSAETYAYVTTAYFVPDERLLAALKGAARRDVDVRLLLPDKTDWNLVSHASHSYYDELLSSGVKIYERQEALLHAKTALIDGVWTTIGSTNLDWLSLAYNQEINAVILGQEFGAEMKAMLDKDIESSRRITLEQWRQRSIVMRLKELGARLLARLL
ncbi:MAG: cardiolipin synthase [Nitrosospira sp.]|nr:cardiolipin synthase [Nitrosospira sp.]